MQSIQKLESAQQLKLLSDPRRLSILRLLMAAPASLTQLGQALGQHPAWVRHHLKQLEAAGLVELVETRVQSGVVEKFYQAKASGWLLQELILPSGLARPLIVFSGSHDLALELLAGQLSAHIDLLSMPTGSLDGLLALRQNLCHLSGCHLLDAGGEYNLPFIRHIFPDRPVRVVTLAHRQQGLMTAPGNPKAIRGLADLARADISLINRNSGSGTRLWLDAHLKAEGVDPGQVRGYSHSVLTHTECARAVLSGLADAALGLEAAAKQAGLSFIPLFFERYDLVFPSEGADQLDPILDGLQAGAFRRQVTALTGYETTHTGEIMQ